MAKPFEMLCMALCGACVWFCLAGADSPLDVSLSRLYGNPTFANPPPILRRRCADKKTAGPLQSGLAKPSGYEITADTYQAMLEGLKQGVGM